MQSNKTHGTSEQATPASVVPVYLALGSNLGDRQNNLAFALQRLHTAVAIDRISSIYETEPVGYLNQPNFLNIVCRGYTSLAPHALLTTIKHIEAAQGRVITFCNAPRPVDIDILLYSNLCLQQENLVIPHPRMAERPFVLVPLVEIAADVIEPVSGKTAQELLTISGTAGVTKLASSLPAPYSSPTT